MLMSRCKDRFITQQDTEHFDGGTDEATFSQRSHHNSLTRVYFFFKSGYQKEEYYLSIDTLLVVVKYSDYNNPTK